jgi:hypothetical protein
LAVLFTNRQKDVIDAMSKPEYGKDQKVRDEVARRLQASHRLGIDLNLRVIHNGSHIA